MIFKLRRSFYLQNECVHLKYYWWTESFAHILIVLCCMVLLLQKWIIGANIIASILCNVQCILNVANDNSFMQIIKNSLKHLLMAHIPGKYVEMWYFQFRRNKLINYYILFKYVLNGCELIHNLKLGWFSDDIKLMQDYAFHISN